ncbi:Mucin-associated surface protein (MASP) [Trypanosoma cruzi]|uniref:Mucin-associated surface protein (MASP), putative n=2 Tax=Trypanosoma cruzi TaxID=5693 RepID=Q4D782_TRYCC|nr:mucin-associated surface protein (MASP), putative [Trypanosoma cruzi]EAN88385.1 mucin-associated surface protein (MASP), putative [Trypanosoma cruzi]PWV01153.1 Mucin-associated surface protein (MASP) [Trypanosoma cruzi]|eukprot:XP_810236.1 mucin-associated surface protein (MASP) [Trypanosoma cruzi strain CL Brener]
MAMMMTGRVLLVCALCVLWCGAGGVVYAMVDRCSEGNGNLLTQMNNAESDGVFPRADCSLLSTQMGLIRAVEAGDKEGAELGGTVTSEKPKQLLSGTTSKGNDDVLTPGSPAPLPTPKVSDQVEQEKPLKTVDPNGIDDTRNPTSGKATESQRQSAGQSSSGSTVTQPGKDHNWNNPSESNASSTVKPTDDGGVNIPPNIPERGAGALEKVKEDEDETKKPKQAVQEEAGEHKENKNDNSPTGSLENAAKMKTIPQETSPSLTKAPAEVALKTIGKTEGNSTQARVNGQSSPEDTVPVQQLQQPQSEMKSNNNSQTEGIAPIAANSQNEPSDGHAETKPPSPTENGNFASNEADKSTEDSTPKNDPAADGTGTREEKKNENKEANPKETVPATNATTGDTATPGDSDSSTAVSHTTFPLLLLLVVACAAAAAVVAA